MQADELESLGVSEVAHDRLNRAIEEFDKATPDATAARNMLEHFAKHRMAQSPASAARRD
jgi:hypothetical protein